MSITMPSQSPAPAAEKIKAKSKLAKSIESPHGEKKRKRQHEEEGHQSKLKKHKSDKNASQSSLIEPSSNPDQISTSSITPKKHKLKSSSKVHKSSQISTSPDPVSRASQEAASAERATPETGHGSIVNGTTPRSTSHAHVLPPSPSSPFHIQTSSLQLPLAPISQKYPLEGLCAEHISPLILTYYPPLDGVLLSYSNARLSEKPFGNNTQGALGECVDEYAVTWCWVTAEFLIFKPNKGQWLEGHVNLQNEGHIGLVCWNLFNTSIERRRLPKDWVWRSAEEAATDEESAEDQTGFFVDGLGEKVEGLLKFRVRQMESNHDREGSFLGIEGTMLDDEEEGQVQEKERNREITAWRSNDSRALGSTSLGARVEDELMGTFANKLNRY